MKRNFFKGAALAAIALAGFTATAQEESKGIELTGSVDAYFRTNIDGKNGANNTAPGTSFVDNDGFSVGFVNLIASKQAGKVGFVADLGFGPRANGAIAGDGTSAIVNQLFVTYAASDAVTFTLGRFNTFLGYEVISPTGNFNYSTSYLFTNGPFSHTGIKVDYAIDDNWSLAGAIMNSTDALVDSNVNGKLTGGLQIGYSQDEGSAYLNALYGRNGTSDEETFQIDLTTGWDLSEGFYLGLNASVNDTDGEGFFGVALYPQYALSEAFSLGLRGEFFSIVSDTDARENDFTAVTLTGSYSVGALTIKPELRLDSSSDTEPFIDTDGDGSDSLSSFVLGAIYSF